MVVPLAFGWRHVLFANWPVDGDAVDARIPDPLSVQEYDGTGWLSVVPFLNVDVRPRGLPERAGLRLPEVNLRTYVTHEGTPGVYFFNLDAQGLLSVLGGRLLHHLPYFYARTSVEWDGERATYESRRRHPGSRPATLSATCRPTGDPFEVDAGSRAEFLTERRRLYTQATDGEIRYTDVDHERWTLYGADATIRENTLFEANGFETPTASPVCYYSPGVDVTTTRSKRWRRSA